MRTRAPHATLADLIDPILRDTQCSSCGRYYDSSCPEDSYEHNNH